MPVTRQMLGHADAEGEAGSDASESEAPHVADTQAPSLTAPIADGGIGERLRRQLRFFFMNPWQKWTARRHLPWKLFLQVVKIVFVTVQLVLFGTRRTTHIGFLAETETVLRHLFLSGWDATRDLSVYPPPAGPLAVYTEDDLYGTLSDAMLTYYSINETAFATFSYNFESSSDRHEFPPLEFCVDRYRLARVFPSNATYTYDAAVETYCRNLSFNASDRAELAGNESTAFLKHYLSAHGIPLHPGRLIRLSVHFTLRTIRLKSFFPSDEPDCFLIGPTIEFDNSEHSGKVPVSLKADVDYFPNCVGELLLATRVDLANVLIGAVDIFVVLVCFVSFILCARALLRASSLRARTVRYFKRHRGETLSLADKLEFVNGWYILIVINDLCIVAGTLFKLSIENSAFDSALFTATGILLGVGCLLVWAGVLRYLGFFPHYNVLILTMKKSLPNVMRFMLCAGLLYCGFALCGWVVLGPYSLKFRTLGLSSSALFSLINGDDMFATFYTLPDSNAALQAFGQAYIYVFIALFIYVVLSLFISIIMDAYEVVKERHEGSDARSLLHLFVAECSDTPRSGNFADSDALCDCDAFRLLWQRLCGSSRRRRSTLGYEEISDDCYETDGTI